MYLLILFWGFNILFEIQVLCMLTEMDALSAYKSKKFSYSPTTFCRTDDPVL